MSPPPGWYADPSGQPQWRWWDGRQWTPHVAGAPAVRRSDPRKVVEEERRTARWAPVGFITEAVTAVLVPWLLLQFLRAFVQWFEAVASDPAAQPPLSMFSLVLGQQAVGLAQLAGLVVVGVWTYRAAGAARDLGIPARRDPGWAVGGWFIPVVNLWWPCQSLQDLLPPEHPARRTILWVWVVFVVGGFVMLGGVVVGGFVDGVTPLVVVAVGAMMSAAGWLSAGRLVHTVLTEHERLASAA